MDTGCTHQILASCNVRNSLIGAFHLPKVNHGRALIYRGCHGLTKIRGRSFSASSSGCSQQIIYASVNGNGKGQPSAQPLPSDDPTSESPFHTGSADITTAGATSSLTTKKLVTEKQIVLVRHGMTTWNTEGIIQGSSDESLLTELGEAQAVRCREALAAIPFDSCFSSPIRRASRFADIVWAGRSTPIVYLDSLREVNLGWLQGMKQKVAATEHEAVFRSWRETPAEFEIDGHKPLDDAFVAAKSAWKDILESPGSTHLVITHKSILRTMLCVALGLPPTGFRAVDVNNAGVTVFRINKRGEPMLIHLNLTSHLYTDGVEYSLAGSKKKAKEKEPEKVLA